MAKLIQISVEVDTETAEAVCTMFNRVHQDMGLAGEETGSQAVIEGLGFPDNTDLDPASVDMAQARRLTVKTYVPAGPQAEELQRRITEGLWWLSRISPLPEPEIAVLEDRDWQEAWKEHYASFRVGRRFVIQPIWETAGTASADIVLRLNPGMAFGTGLHPSTQLCLCLLESHAAGCSRLLDVGTGSGILAIAALGLGVTSVMATDTDARALQTARENAGYNCAHALQEQRLSFWAGSLPPDGLYDVAVVNILPHVIVQLLEEQHLLDWVRPNGLVILSGIIEDRAQEVEASLQALGCQLVERRQQEDWVALAGRKTFAEA